MALTTLLTQQTYQSNVVGQIYTFTVGLDQGGNSEITNIRTPFGQLCNTTVGLPGAVLEDINTALSNLETLVAQTSAVNGTLTYADENSQSFSFTTPFGNDEYAVIPTLPEFLSWRVTDKTTTGFTLELSTNFTGDIRFDVFV